MSSKTSATLALKEKSSDRLVLVNEDLVALIRLQGQVTLCTATHCVPRLAILLPKSLEAFQSAPQAYPGRVVPGKTADLPVVAYTLRPRLSLVTCAFIMFGGCANFVTKRTIGGPHTRWWGIRWCAWWATVS